MWEISASSWFIIRTEIKILSSLLNTKYNKNTEDSLSLSCMLKISIVMIKGATVSNGRSESLYGYTDKGFTPEPKKYTTINGREAFSSSFYRSHLCPWGQNLLQRIAVLLVASCNKEGRFRQLHIMMLSLDDGNFISVIGEEFVRHGDYPCPKWRK